VEAAVLDDLRRAARRLGADRAVKALLAECRRLLSERGEANSLAIASGLVQRLQALNDEQRRGFFDALAQAFSPDPQAVLAAAQAYAAAPTAEHLIALTQASEPPRQELLRRISRAAGGVRMLVSLRRALLAQLDQRPEWKAVEADFLHLFSSWFNAGFLQMRRVDWNAPAQLLEQLIQHEAVHAIDGWDDLRRRLQPDRRCFAFFHPQLPDEPLIFVEVALVPEMAAAIAPLIDKKSTPLPPAQFKVAVFYSISNCQPGLRGVSLGNFLIKRVADELKRELPQLKTFCTLSPIPGLMAWLARLGPRAALPGLKAAAAAGADQALATLRQAAGADLAALAQRATLEALPVPAQQALLQLATLYLVQVSPTAAGDPVARFHLDNGARLERLNPQANLSPKGLKQSAGLMVNYLYDLDRVETCHERFMHGRVVHSRAITSLM
jgi:malonyl-CoA decarboxylase